VRRGACYLFSGDATHLADGEFDDGNFEVLDRMLQVSRVRLLIAMSALWSIAQTAPAFAETDAETGVKEFNAKNYRGALERFRAQLVKTPRDVQCNYYAALCYQYLGNTANALAMYKRVVLLAPESEMARNCHSIIVKLSPREAASGTPSANAAPAVSRQVGKSVGVASRNETPDALSTSFSTCVRSAHFSVYSNSGESYVASSFLECFLEFVNVNVCKVNPSFHRNVFIFDTADQYHNYAATALDSTEGSYGVYVHSRRAFFTYANSGIGTYAHEMMHAVFFEQNIELEAWADEGIPALFEKIFGCCDRGRPVFLYGYPNPWRYKALGAELTKLNLAQMVSDPAAGKNYNTSQKREIGLFLFKHGQLRRYIELVQAKNKNGYDTYFEAALQRRLSDLGADWFNFLKTEQGQANTIEEIPSSRFFDTRAELECFVKSDGRVLGKFK